MEDNPARVYGFSFAPAGKGIGLAPPEIVFQVARDYVALGEGHLRNPLLYQMVPASEYLAEPGPFLFPDQPNLFGLEEGMPRCGFQNCAYLTESDSGRDYHLPLERHMRKELALTLNALLVAHNQGMLSEHQAERATNLTQLVSLDTVCGVSGFYAHGAHGHVFPSMRRWLYDYAQRTTAEPSSLSCNRPLPDSVHDAVWQAWLALSDESDFREFEKETCSGVVSSEGRFLLHCPGNACDLAMYPDHDYGPDSSSGLGCHNLDAAEQQLALIAGLAALHDLASRDLG